MQYCRRVFFGLCFLFCITFTQPVFVKAAELVGFYDFDNSLTDTLGLTTLSTLPTNTTSGFNTTIGASDPSYWYWTSADSRGGGFFITTPQDLLNSSDYSIGLRFAYNDLDTGYNKIIDYKNRVSDNGFYFYNRRIMFYPGSGSGTKVINPGDILDMIVTRNGTSKLFTVYFVVNGTLTKEFEYTDSSNYAVANVVDDMVKFGFFHDDNHTSGEATSDGKVYSIKLWNGAIGESAVAQAMNPKYIVSFNDNVADEEISMPPIQEVEEDSQAIEPTSPSRSNYTFGGWYTTSDLATPWNFDDPITQNRTLYAKWTINTFTINFLASSNGSITGPSPQTIDYGGDTVSVTATATSGYHFTNWSDGNTQNPRQIIGVTSSQTLTANFAANDINAPVISSVGATVFSNQATITWSTNEPASSRVQYGLNQNYGFITTESNTSPRVTDHTINLSGLKSCARYFYRVISTDSTSNQSASPQKTFNTTGCSASTITTGTETTLPVTGGTVQLVNSLSTAELNVPNDYAEEPATFQINKLDTSQAPSVPSGKSIAANNFYDLIAVTESNEQITSFSTPVTFTVSYGSDIESDYIESTLDIYKYDGTSWIKKNCLLDMDANTLTCNLNSFSTYAVLGSTVVTNASSSNTSPQPGNPHCSESPPVLTPNLFQIDALSTTAKLFFTPIDYNQFYISFSTNPDAEMHGEQVTLTREGVQSETIYHLKPNTVYYLKVRGQNGCMPGNWSNTLQFTTNNSVYYRYFPRPKSQTKVVSTTVVDLPTVEPDISVTPTNSLPTKPPEPTATFSPPVKSTSRCFLWWCW